MQRSVNSSGYLSAYYALPMVLRAVLKRTGFNANHPRGHRLTFQCILSHASQCFNLNQRNKIAFKKGMFPDF